MRRFSGPAWAAAAAASYAALVVLGKALDAGNLPFVLLSVRFGGQALVLGSFVIVLRQELRWYGSLVLVGAAFLGTEAAAYFTALNHGSAGAVTLVFYTYPAWTMLGHALRHREMPTRADVLALGLALVGVAVLSFGRGVQIDGTGTVLALFAGAGYAAYLLGAARGSRGKEPLSSAVSVSIGAAATNVVLMLAFTETTLPRPAFQLTGIVAFSAFTAVGVIQGLQRIGAVRTAVIAVLGPPFALLLGAAFLGESVTAPTLVGGALILGGALLSSRETYHVTAVRDR